MCGSQALTSSEWLPRITPRPPPRDDRPRCSSTVPGVEEEEDEDDDFVNIDITLRSMHRGQFFTHCVVYRKTVTYNMVPHTAPPFLDRLTFRRFIPLVHRLERKFVALIILKPVSAVSGSIMSAYYRDHNRSYGDIPPRHGHSGYSAESWYGDNSSGGSPRLLVMLEVYGTLMFIHPTSDIRHPEAYGRPIATPDGYIYIRRGADRLLRLLKDAAANCDIDLAVSTCLDTNLARYVVRTLDSDLPKYAYIYDSYFSKPDIAPTDTDSTAETATSTSSLRDFNRLWHSSSRSGPASYHSRWSTVMLDCSVGRNREFPNNLVHIPEFSAETALITATSTADPPFAMHQVMSYLSRVLNDWVANRTYRDADVRTLLRSNLMPQARRWNKLLLLVDMNGTFLLRARSKVPNQGPPFVSTKNSTKTVYYYLRPGAERFVKWLIAKQEICDCVDVAFYTSMKEENALVPLKKLDRRGDLYLYSQDFNKHDRSGENAWDMMRDFPKLWSTQYGPAFGHSERSTIMIDDSLRKMREFPTNLILVPEFVPERLMETELFKLEYVMTYVDAVLDQWMRTYTFDRDVRDMLAVHNPSYVRAFQPQCRAAAAQDVDV